MPDDPRYPRRLLPGPPPDAARVPYGPELPPGFVPPPQVQPLPLGHAQRISDDRSWPVRALDYLVGDEGGGEELLGSKLLGRLNVAQDQLSRPPEGVMGAAPLTPGDLKGLTELPGAARGLYSRVDELLKRLPKKGVHPNKLKSLLRSGASNEEIAARKVDEFLMERFDLKGEQPVTPEELGAHLKANPAPFPKVTTLGETGERKAMQARLNELAVHGGDRTPEMEVEYDRLSRRLLQGQTSGGEPKYAAHTLPGGENYAETLLQRRRPSVKDYPNRADYNAAIDAAPEAFVSGHFDEPDVLAHVRAKDRTLAAPPPEMPKMVQPAADDLAKQGYTVRVDREDSFSGRRQMTILDPEGNFVSSRGMTSLTPEEYLHEHAIEQGVSAYNDARATPQGPKGRFIEEVQSDWHQQGKKRGYQQAATPEKQAREAQLTTDLEMARVRVSSVNQQLDEARNAYLAQLQAATLPHLPPEYKHLTSFGDATREGEPAVRAWRAAREAGMAGPARPSLQQLRETENALQQQLHTAVDRTTGLQTELGTLSKPTGVPDAPFKESWPDLALKQQILDVAERPDLDWIGMTTGKTQADRYDLSKQISKLEYDPRDQRLIGYDHDGSVVISEFTEPTPEALEEYIGKEPAAALHKKITDQEASREWERTQWGVEEDADNPGRFYIYDPNGELLYQHGGTPERFGSAERAQARIDELVNGEVHYGEPKERPNISGLDLQVGGEGMAHFYDNLLPKRLEKILKPFGGGPVTRERVAALPTGAIPQGNPSLEEAEAWVARLTPEMKERIRREGLPLMLVPFLLAAGTAGSASQVGTPPPVQPPSKP